MEDHSDDQRNPFATRFLRPGQIPYFFRPGETLIDLHAAWSAASRLGQIVGPHGSGKSTLLAAWEDHLRQQSVPVHRVTATATRPLPAHNAMVAWQDIGPEAAVIVDGYEQFSAYRRWRLKRAVHTRGAGFLVTCHHSLRFPWTYRPRTDLQNIQSIVRWLQRNTAALVNDDDVAQARDQCGDNTREILFALYDVYRNRSRDGR